VLLSLDCSHFPTYAIVTFREVRRKSEYSIYTANRIPTNKGVQLDPNSITLTSERQLHYGPVASVIAQQHSSATFVSLHFNSRKENFVARFKNYFFNVILFLKLPKPGGVSVLFRKKCAVVHLGLFLLHYYNKQFVIYLSIYVDYMLFLKVNYDNWSITTKRE
jgi:hypothetical protein